MKKKSLVNQVVVRDIDFEYHDISVIHSRVALARLPKHAIERIYEHQLYKDNYVIQPNPRRHDVVTLRSCKVFPDNVKYFIYKHFKETYLKP